MKKILKIIGKILQIIGVISIILGFILQFQGVVDFTEFIDIMRHPVIIEPSKILVSEAIVKQKTVCYLRNRSNKIQKNVGVSIEAPDCSASANISVKVEPDAFRSVKIGTSDSYIDFDPAAILYIIYTEDGIHNCFIGIASHDFGPLETERISITVDPSDYDKWDSDSHILLNVFHQ